MKKKKILILGASSDMGLALLERIKFSNSIVGAHCFRGSRRLEKWIQSNNINLEIKILKKNLSNQKNCHQLFAEFIKWSKDIDSLIQLNGSVSKVISWEKIKEKNWFEDISINLAAPFFVAQKAFDKMKKKGGKIILMSTGSAKHGGGSDTMSYGISKTGVETFAKGIARVGAKYNIIVNVVAPGFFNTRFHKKNGRTQQYLRKRASLSRLKRMGDPVEVALLIQHLLSEEANYMTGEVISLTGGDWI